MNTLHPLLRNLKCEKSNDRFLRGCVALGVVEAFEHAANMALRSLLPLPLPAAAIPVKLISGVGQEMR